MFNAIAEMAITVGFFVAPVVVLFVFEWAKFIVGTVIDEHRSVRRI